MTTILTPAAQRQLLLQPPYPINGQWDRDASAEVESITSGDVVKGRQIADEAQAMALWLCIKLNRRTVKIVALGHKFTVENGVQRPDDLHITLGFSRRKRWHVYFEREGNGNIAIRGASYKDKSGIIQWLK